MFHAVWEVRRPVVAEGCGSAFLLAAVVGSGIMGERLAGGNVALALLANTLSTSTILVALILAFAPVSGAHFNPAVTLAEAWQRRLAWTSVPAYLAAQIVGALTGVAAAHLMFGEPLFAPSHHPHSGLGQLLSEFIATFGLVTVVSCCSQHCSPHTALAVGAYISSAYWFTASTSFANPAVTVARSLTDTFAGIRPVDVASFVAAQLLGAAAAVRISGWLFAAFPSVVEVETRRSRKV